MNLSGTQLKDTYGNLLTIGTTAGSPTSGGLQNGQGTLLTKVGIGTSSINGKLDIKNSNAGFEFFPENSTDTNLIINFDRTTSTYQNLQIRAATHQFLIDASEKMRIDSSGNVGIGQTNPSSHKLHVASSASFAPLAIFENTGSGQSLVQIKSPSASILEFGDNDDGNVGAIQYYHADNSMRFKTNDSEKMRIDSSGNVGIGTTPFGWSSYGVLNVKGSGAIYGTSAGSSLSGLSHGAYYDGTNWKYAYTGVGATRYESVGSASPYQAFYTANSGTADNNITWSESMRIDSSGNVGIGTTSPANDVSGLHISVASSTDQLYLERTGSGTGRYYLGTASNSLFIVDDAQSAERMRIDSSGNVLVGTTGEPNGTSVYGSAFVDAGSGIMQLKQASSTTSAISVQRFYNPNGNVGSIQLNGSATSYVTSSDYRLKENVVPMEGALDRVAQLKPSRFNFIADADTIVDGFLAHEVADIVPEAITGEKDAVDEEGNPIYQGIDHSKLVPLLVGAIQELRAEIEQLKAK